MSRLDELIAELCPDGVEYKNLGELSKIETGKLNANAAVENGEYLFFTTAKTISRINKYRWDTEAILIAGNANVGEVKHYKGKFDAYQRTYVLTQFSKMIKVRFLYFFLSSNLKQYLESRSNSAAMTYIVLSTLQDFPIPIPPLPIQQEIVRILDTFTELEAELEAELEERKKQYEYYRDRLLAFEPDMVKWMLLDDIIISLNTGLNPRQFFRLNTDDAKNYYITIRELQNNRIIFTNKTDRINDEAMRLCNNRSNLEINDVLFSGTGTIGTTAIIETQPINWNIKEGVYAIKPKQELIIPRFLMYLLNSKQIRSQYMQKAAGGTVKSVPMNEMRKLRIPLPPLSEQERIVAILDRFDALCNDLTSGLPAEIEARRKQYEYYRDKLLTFQEAKA
ncbi:MAG: restriction endonuclease subunit S [Rectinema subterraneum]